MYYHNCFRTPEYKELKSLMCNYLKGFKIETSNIKGTVKLQNIRFYRSAYTEVEVVFEGQIRVRYYRAFSWYGNEILDFTDASKIKINRKIKKEIFSDLRRKLKFFDVRITEYSQIKKIKWM